MDIRRGLLLLSSLAAAVAALALLTAFLWPANSGPDEVNLGPVEDLPVGHARFFPNIVEFSDFRWDVDTLMQTAQRSHEVTIAVVRHEDGSVSAFLQRDPRNGCPLRWRTDLGESFGLGGFFRDPCHGATYDAYGVRVFGPSPRNMDYFDAEVNDAGEVVVDLRTLHEGASQLREGPDGTPTPASTPWPTATARPRTP